MSKILKIFTLFSLIILGCCASADNNRKIKKIRTFPAISFKHKSMMAQGKNKAVRKSMNSKPTRQTRSHHKNIKTKTIQKPYIHHIHKNVPKFDKLLIDGNINVELHSGYTRPSITLIGDPRDLIPLMTKVEKHTLVLYAGAGIPDYAPIKIIVKGRYIHEIKLKNNARIKGLSLKVNHLELDVEDHSSAHLGGYLMANRINIKDHGSVKLTGVKSKHLQICLKDHANLKINGKANIDSLEAGGNSHFSIAWVDSWNLKAKVTGHAYVQLAGVVNKLDACIYDNAHWNGRFLRSRRTYMKTFDKALARISAVNKQHTLALGKSNIYFYNLSTYRTDFMAMDGSVLDMRTWEMRAKNDYDHYNKPG